MQASSYTQPLAALPHLPYSEARGYGMETTYSKPTASLSRRPSRGSSSHRHSTSMRVAKPSSASNSPQALWGSSRRRTMMNDTATSQRTQQVLEQLLVANQSEANTSASGRSARPVSWHPGSLQKTYGMPTPFDYQTSTSHHRRAHKSPLEQQQTSPSYSHPSPLFAASYSTAASPVSTFSPLPVSYPDPNGKDGLYPVDAWQNMYRTPYYLTPNENPGCTEAFPLLDGDIHSYHATANSLEWSSYMVHGVNSNTTTPPTPESLVQPQATFSAVPQESPSFQPLDEPEDESEVLVGMGLYDTPDKVEDDPQLDNYRSTVSSLLGSRFREESQGKGLKLEETWAPPPKSDDEDEDGDDDDQETSSSE